MFEILVCVSRVPSLLQKRVSYFIPVDESSSIFQIRIFVQSSTYQDEAM